jgi:hypothetical protein
MFFFLPMPFDQDEEKASFSRLVVGEEKQSIFSFPIRAIRLGRGKSLVQPAGGGRVPATLFFCPPDAFPLGRGKSLVQPVVDL